MAAWSVIVYASVAGWAFAGDVGDAAAPIDVPAEHWLNGGAVDPSKPGDTIYVVEFWATWCGPCKVSIPHLTEMQHKYAGKNVVIIGVTKDDPNNTWPMVQEFVKGQGKKMDYRVAYDRDGGVYEKYMDAFGQGGIPHAFVVDKQGRIAWHGHPMVEMDETIDKMLSGTYSVESFRKLNAAREAIKQYGELAAQDTYDATAARQVGEQVFAVGSDSRGIMFDLAKAIMELPNEERRDLELALRAARAAYDQGGDKDLFVLDIYAQALFASGDAKEALKIQRVAVTKCKDIATRTEFNKALQKYYKAASKG